MLLHQVHLAKIGVDVTASIVLDVLLWQALPKVAVAVRVLLPQAAGREWPAQGRS